MAEDREFSSVGEKYVCEDCIDDYAIREFIRSNATRNKCDYCGAEEDEPIAAHLDEVIEFMLEGIETEWGDPYDVGNSYDNEDDKWLFAPVTDSWDLILELEIPISEGELYEDICESLMDREWCRRYPLHPSESERLIWGWRDFAEQVKHRARYVFFRARSSDTSPAEIDPSDMLDELSKVISEIGLVRPLVTGTEIFRAREHKSHELPATATELGSPPREFAKYSNRMSPAGIPMFYGAFDEPTALAEINHPTVATTGVFSVLQEMPVIDLTVLPPVPSLFDPAKRQVRSGIIFLHDFAREVSKPIEKDGREHIEYVPTQVFTEYFRHIYRDSAGKNVQGILYRSARKEGSTACVLFLENQHCCDALKGDESDKEKWLRLIRCNPLGA